MTVCTLIMQIIKDLVTLFPVIRDWIAEFLMNNQEMTATMVGRNMLIGQVNPLSQILHLSVLL